MIQEKKCFLTHPNIHATAKTKQLQLGVRLVCGPPPGWFVASIPDGIAREDGNLTEVFFFFD